MVGIFTNSDLLPTLAKVLADTPTVKYIIYDGDKADSSIVDKLVQTREGIKVVTLDELLEDGTKNPVDFNPPKGDDVACIMYTCVVRGLLGAALTLLAGLALLASQRALFSATPTWSLPVRCGYP